VRAEALDLLRAYDAGPFAQLVKVRWAPERLAR
jgi:hypothetical protein